MKSFKKFEKVMKETFKQNKKMNLIDAENTGSYQRGEGGGMGSQNG